ncbi:MAG: acyl carrier protein [Anaerolineae bacterium]|jgi:acyl carrier protein|nr:acyl carrier protein [Anaerolineae bacterium]
MNLYDQLNEVFREVFADDSIQLTPETTADDIEGWDSLSHVNLMIAVELKFGIEFTQKEIRSFDNVGQMAACVQAKLTK